MSQSRNSINKEIKFCNSQDLSNLKSNNRCLSRNINNNNLFQNKSKLNNSHFSTKETTPRKDSVNIDEENILIQIIENKKKEESLSEISKLFYQKDLNYYQIHDKILYNNNQNNFLYNTIIKNNSKRINEISNKLSSMKNPDDISTKETKSIIFSNKKKYERKSRNNKNEDLEKVSCCCFGN